MKFDFEEYWKENGIHTNPEIMGLAFKECAKKAVEASQGLVIEECAKKSAGASVCKMPNKTDVYKFLEMNPIEPSFTDRMVMRIVDRVYDFIKRFIHWEKDDTPCESYGSGWVEVKLMIHESGEIHCVGGDREGDSRCDSPYIGAERLRAFWDVELGKMPPARPSVVPKFGAFGRI